jgi:hypothetical protein
MQAIFMCIEFGDICTLFFNILLLFHIIHWMYLMVGLLDGEAAAGMSAGEDPDPSELKIPIFTQFMHNFLLLTKTRSKKNS